jgi:hypothetical protein
MAVEFEDSIMDFGTFEARFQVLFARRAAAYFLSTSRSDFETQVAAIARAWRQRAPVRVTADGTDIVSINLAEGR